MNELLNRMTPHDATVALTRCCAASAWVEGMVRHRPFRSPAAVDATADWLWWRLERSDWLQAFAGHPRIGGDIEQLRAKFHSTAAWSADEQRQVEDAGHETLQRLADGNRAYEVRFGYIFIVCATGKTADEMLELLERRLNNPPEEELLIAAEQQRQITRLRLEKLRSS